MVHRHFGYKLAIHSQTDDELQDGDYKLQYSQSILIAYSQSIQGIITTTNGGALKAKHLKQNV